MQWGAADDARRVSATGGGQNDAAEVAAVEQLPIGWEEAVSRSTGETYYVNQATGESTYERPRGGGGSGGSGSDGVDDTRSSTLPDGWTAAISRSSGEAYFVNSLNGESTYERPTETVGGPELVLRWDAAASECDFGSAFLYSTGMQ